MSITQVQADAAVKERQWYLSRIVNPELGNVTETLTICHNLLVFNSPQEPNAAECIERGPSIKLPVSSNKLEILKGILVRDGPHIISLTMILKEKSFNKYVTKLTLIEPIELPQIALAIKCIKDALNQLINAIHCLDLSIMASVLAQIKRAKDSLNLLTDTSLAFPFHAMPASKFSPELPNEHVAVDIYVNQQEICVDLKRLHKITVKPWGDINPVTGKSYVDMLRDEMKISTSSDISQLQKEVEAKFTHTHTTKHSSETSSSSFIAGTSIPLPNNSNNNNVESSSSLASFFLSLLNRYTPMDYVTKCITYNDSVVMVNNKIEVLSLDPVVVSVFTKLDSLEYLIGNYMLNLESLN